MFKLVEGFRNFFILDLRADAVYRQTDIQMDCNNLSAASTWWVASHNKVFGAFVCLVNC